MVNTGNATAKDVIEVSESCEANCIWKKTGKQIELEIELLGEF